MHRGRGMSLFVDVDKCTGCHVCQLICSFSHFGLFIPSKSFIRVEIGYPYTKKPITCTLCEECVDACVQEALAIDPKLGCISVNRIKCNGCEECIEVCSLHLPIFDEKEGIPIFCDLCGGDPLCVKWCPKDAITVKQGGDNH